MQEIINAYVEVMEKQIPNDELEKKNLLEALRKHLLLGVQIIQNSDSKFISKDEESVKRIMKVEFEKIMQMNIVAMKQYLIEDKHYEEIKKISKQVFNMAIMKSQGNEISEKFQVSIEELDKLLIGVKEYNKKLAQNLISETLLDLAYIENRNSGILSMRLYHFLGNKNQDDREEI